MKKTAVQVYCKVCEKNYWMDKTPYNLFVKNEEKPGEAEFWIDSHCPNGQNHYFIKRDKEYTAIPLEKKQTFLDLWRKGGITLGEASKQVGLSSEMAAQVLLNSIGEYHYLKENVTK